MKPLFVTAMSAILLTTLASAQDPKACASRLSLGELAPSMGGSVRIQPVFALGDLKGWRLYGTTQSPQLSSHGIGEGSLMTAICGVPARELKGAQDVCCPLDVSREFDVTFELRDGEKKITIVRP